MSLRGQSPPVSLGWAAGKLQGVARIGHLEKAFAVLLEDRIQIGHASFHLGHASASCTRASIFIIRQSAPTDQIMHQLINQRLSQQPRQDTQPNTRDSVRKRTLALRQELAEPRAPTTLRSRCGVVQRPWPRRIQAYRHLASGTPPCNCARATPEAKRVLESVSLVDSEC